MFTTIIYVKQSRIAPIVAMLQRQYTGFAFASSLVPSAGQGMWSVETTAESDTIRDEMRGFAHGVYACLDEGFCPG